VAEGEDRVIDSKDVTERRAHVVTSAGAGQDFADYNAF